ncbi:hypothetical protein ES703_116420 [subsurface metagenome]
MGPVRGGKDILKILLDKFASYNFDPNAIVLLALKILPQLNR